MRVLIVLILSTTLFSCQQANKSLIKESTQVSDLIFASSESFQLSNPFIQLDSVVFQSKTKVDLGLDMPGVEIRYTTDGSEVNEKSSKFEKTLEFSASTILRVKAYHPNFRSSEEIQQSFFKSSISPYNLEANLSVNPHSNYPGQGAASLTDLKKGTLDFRKNNVWLGFNEKEIEINLVFKQPSKAEKLIVSVLEDHGSWIFLPKSLKVYHQNKLLVSKEFEQAQNPNASKIKFLVLELPNKKLENLSLKITSFEGIPPWHPGKGNVPWLFIDELFFE